MELETESTQKFRASCVVIADGGFQANMDMLRAYKISPAPEKLLARNGGTAVGDGLRSVARAAFTIEQHHRQVVLTERRAALSSDLEVTPRLDMVAHEPRRPALHDLRFQVWN
jgi:hypothetical protein